jgi:hypothetical protein
VALRTAALLLLLLAAVGCSHSDSPAEEQATSAAASATGQECPVTKPNGKAPPGEAASPRHHGSGRLWTILYYPTLVATERSIQPDGSIQEKFPWWRGVQGELTIQGERIDGAASPVRADVPPGYGDIGFQATSIIFSSEGCWRVTGTVAGESLTFVVFVKRES